MVEKGDLFVDMVRPDSGCDLANNSPFAIFQGVFDATNGELCDGCGYHNGCTFMLKRALKGVPRVCTGFGASPYRETVAEIAKKLGISRRQVRKMRRDGSLK